MDVTERIQSEVLKLEDYLIRTRREIHKYAETNGTEVKTNAYIRAELDRAGIPYQAVAKTALIATFDTGRPGPGVLLRADIDALPIRENPNNLAGPRSCRSEQENTCHACGHDAHTAMLLGSLRVLCEIKDTLCGVIYLCFEQGEECGGSVDKILEAIKPLKIDTVWAIHVNPELQSGQISVEAGPRMAGAAGVEILVKGRGGHGSRPDLSVNPVYTAAAIVTNIPGAFVNQLNPESPVTFGVTTIMGGGTGNIFADTAEIKGSLRFFDAQQGQKAVEIVKSVSEHTAAMNKCTVEFGATTQVLVSPVINDAGCAELAADALMAVLPDGAVAHANHLYGSESFSRYLQRAPGVFALLGVNNPEAGCGATLHNQFFDVDETVLKIGVASTVSYAVAFMEKYICS